jgi:hypothetical protein
MEWTTVTSPDDLTPAGRVDVLMQLIERLGLRVTVRWMPDIGGYEYKIEEIEDEQG